MIHMYGYIDVNLFLFVDNIMLPNLSFILFNEL